MLYNLKVLDYGDFLHVEYFTRPIKRTQEEKADTITSVTEKKISIIEDLQRDLLKDKNSEHNLSVSMNRSKNNLYRIARSNKWDLFITITFDRKKVDASDYKDVSGKITNWLNNLRKRGSPDLKYLIVPEFHKDGINYHFHGLIAGADSLILKDSGHKDFAGEVIYNIENWKYGFTTATKIKDNARVTNYIGKYITKDLMNRLKYKKRYFASRNCDVVPEELLQIHPDDLYYMFDPDDISYLKTINIDGVNKVKYFEVKKD